MSYFINYKPAEGKNVLQSENWQNTVKQVCREISRQTQREIIIKENEPEMPKTLMPKTTLVIFIGSRQAVGCAEIAGTIDISLTDDIHQLIREGPTSGSLMSMPFGAFACEQFAVHMSQLLKRIMDKIAQSG